MIKYNLYIGSNNDTKQLEEKHIIDLVSAWYEGFTCYKVKGFWKGVSEDAMKVEICVEDTSVNTLAINQMVIEMKRMLNQESIMVEKVNSVIEFK